MTRANQTGRIIVVGSANTDMILKTERLPQPGETILGGGFAMAAGGKGANQAVAAARLGDLHCAPGSRRDGHSARTKPSRRKK